MNTPETLKNEVQAAVENSGIPEAAETLTDNVRRTADEIIGRSAKALREGSASVKDAASKTLQCTADYARDKPFQALLIAAAAGALIAAAASMAARRRSHH